MKFKYFNIYRDKKQKKEESAEQEKIAQTREIQEKIRCAYFEPERLRDEKELIFDINGISFVANYREGLPYMGGGGHVNIYYREHGFADMLVLTLYSEGRTISYIQLGQMEELIIQYFKNIYDEYERKRLLRINQVEQIFGGKNES